MVIKDLDSTFNLLQFAYKFHLIWTSDEFGKCV